MTFVDGQRRFLIRRDGWLQPLVFLVGLARDSNSYVAIEGDRLRVRFGWFFNQTFALGDIEAAETMRWPWYYGLGWRANLAGLIGVVASLRGVVGIRLRERQRVGGIVPFVRLGCDRLAVSLREPEDFIAALRRAGVGIDPR
ncbi:MAG TPA: hypothetical protein VFS30_03505 [Dehalococcoidia bacterium]|nr:hypothetical protein [Dehalococcoidia bacterium]